MPGVNRDPRHSHHLHDLLAKCGGLAVHRTPILSCLSGVWCYEEYFGMLPSREEDAMTCTGIEGLDQISITEHHGNTQLGEANLHHRHFGHDLE
jgi:hypothetical protein